MQIQSVMKPVSRTLSEDDSLTTAASNLEAQGLDALPVCHTDGSLAGIVTAEVVTSAGLQFPDAARSTSVSAVMSKQIKTCLETDDVLSLAFQAAREGVSHLIVVDRQGGLQGMADLSPYQANRSRDQALDEALEETFPASDPIAPP